MNKVTKEQLNLFVICGKHYLNELKEPSELSKAIETVLPEAIKKLQKVERQRDMFRISLAKKTATKHLDLDRQGRYQHTEDDTLKIFAKMEEIDKEEVNLHSTIIEEYPDEGLSYDIRQAFQGIVIPAKLYPKYKDEEEPKDEEEESQE